MNLRSDSLTDYQAIVELFRSRRVDVLKRKELETRVSEHNGKLCSSLKSLLEGTSNKLQIPFSVTIYDLTTTIEISVSTHAKLKHATGFTRTIGFNEPYIGTWFESVDALKKRLYDVELNLRLIRRMLKRENLTPTQTPNVVVMIETNNKYFH